VTTAYLVTTALVALIVGFSAVAKIRRDPGVVKVMEAVGAGEYLAALAACKLAGAAGLLVGIWLPIVGVAAGTGLVIYFVGAVVSHLRVGDVKGIGPAAFMLAASEVAPTLRLLTM
jgi:hypothetical protein